MNRRQFSRTLSGAVLGSAVLPALAPGATADSQVPFHFSVMLWTILRDRPFEERIEKVAAAGYHAVELVNEYEKWSPEDFRHSVAKLRALNIVVDAMAGVWTGIADPNARDKFLADLNKLVAMAEQLECPAIIVLSGNRGLIL